MINFAVFFKLFYLFYFSYFNQTIILSGFLWCVAPPSPISSCNKMTIVAMWKTKVGESTIVYIFSTAQQSFFLFFINVGLVFVHLIKDILYFSSGYAFSDSINLSKSSSSKRKYLHFF